MCFCGVILCWCVSVVCFGVGVFLRCVSVVCFCNFSSYETTKFFLIIRRMLSTREPFFSRVSPFWLISYFSSFKK